MLRIILLALLSFIFEVHATNIYGDGSVNAGFQVVCNSTTMTVYFNKTTLDARSISGVTARPYAVTFSGTTTANCTTDASGNVATAFDGGKTNFEDSVFLSGNYPDDCGIVQTEETDYFQYSQVITVAYGRTSADPSISRMEYDNYTVSCKLNRTLDTKLTGDFYNVSHRVEGAASGEDDGTFNITLTHHAKGTSQTQQVYKVGDLIAFQHDFHGPNLKAVVQQCWATSDGVNAHKYMLIDNKCATDAGTEIVLVRPEQTVFDVEAFRFLSPDVDQVYIECVTQVCLPNDVSGACAFCNPFGRRKRRTAAEDDARQSPLKRRIVRSPRFSVIRSTDSKEESIHTKSKNGRHHDVIISSWQGMLIIALLTVMVVVKFGEIATRKYRKAKQNGLEYQRVTENETV